METLQRLGQRRVLDRVQHSGNSFPPSPIESVRHNLNMKRRVKVIKLGFP